MNDVTVRSLPAERLTLAQVAVAMGVSTFTVRRWVIDGVGGKRLMAFRLGGRRFTTAAACDAFLAEINAADGKD